MSKTKQKFYKGFNFTNPHGNLCEVYKVMKKNILFLDGNEMKMIPKNTLELILTPEA